MKRTTIRKRSFSLRMAVCTALVLLGTAGNLKAVSLEEAMEAALSNDTTLADARSRLKIAENAVQKASSVYGSSLSLSTSASSATQPDQSAKTSVGANLSIPLAKWITLGAEGSTNFSATTGSISVSLNPLAKADTSANTAYAKALIEAQSAVRTTLLGVRKEYRALVTARSEYEYRKASVRTAENELSRIGYLVELGKERKSKEITAYGDLMEAQGNLDAALNAVNAALQTLAGRTGLPEADLETAGAESVPGNTQSETDRILLDEEAWLQSSAERAIAALNLEQQKYAAKTAFSLPGLSVGASVSDSASWSVTAKVTVSPDIFFQKNADSSSENLLIQERSFEKTEQNVRTAWKNQQNALAMAQRNYANALRFLESATVSYEETELLFGRGESSQSGLDESKEKLLSATWQAVRAEESLENAMDQLDAAWQLALQ